MTGVTMAFTLDRQVPALALRDRCANGGANRPASFTTGLLGLVGGLIFLLLAGCASDTPVPTRSALTPAEQRSLITRAMPTGVTEREAWVTDIQAAFGAMQLPVNVVNICSVVAVAEQESSFRADPKVPGMASIAWREIDAKADRAGIPKFAVRTALQLPSPGGKTYSERIDAATTERDLSEIFEDFIGMAPLGKRLFEGYNPVRTGGPMQVSISYAQQHVAGRPYPYPVKTNIRGEVFTRRGGMYFGIAHLLDYPVSYPRPLFRFADYNAGHYTSRNAAFQNAVTLASAIPLALDGDLVDPSSKQAGATELATRVLQSRLSMTEADIRADLEQEKSPAFERTALYQRVFALADAANHAPVPRAVLPRIQLKSPKITRNLTSDWFANRVESRYQACLKKAA